MKATCVCNHPTCVCNHPSHLTVLTVGTSTVGLGWPSRRLNSDHAPIRCRLSRLGCSSRQRTSGLVTSRKNVGAHQQAKRRILGMGAGLVMRRVIDTHAGPSDVETTHLQVLV